MGSYSVQWLSGGWYAVSDGERRWHVAVAGSGESTWVFVEGQVARLEAPPTLGARKRAKGGGESTVMSPMPASVVSVNVSCGDTVKQGDTLIVLEAMKMELPIRAPRDGVVATLHCAKGDLVQPGVNLLEFE